MKILLASELNTYGFCPTKLWMERSLRRVSLRRRLRMALGELWHLLQGLLARGEKERLLACDVEEFGIRLAGRPDVLRDLGEVVEVVEHKSGRAPRLGKYWRSDSLQAMAYCYLVRRVTGKEARCTLKYLDRSEEVEYDEAELMEAIRGAALVIGGYLPEPELGSRCRSCDYLGVCEQLRGFKAE